jgi:hypothetical protein
MVIKSRQEKRKNRRLRATGQIIDKRKTGEKGPDARRIGG